MKKAFTMIELIFVIVIIGILAAVAIPKLAETSKEAHNINVVAFISSMNRTVGTTMWTKVITNGGDGIIDCANLSSYINLIDEVTHTGNCEFSVNAPATGVIKFIPAADPKAEVPTWNYDADG